MKRPIEPGRAGVAGRRLAAAVLAGQHALRERRPDDLPDPVARAEREHLALGLPPQRAVLRLAGDEARHAGQRERLLDPRAGHSLNPMQRALPASTTSVSAPIVSSSGTVSS